VQNSICQSRKPRNLSAGISEIRDQEKTAGIRFLTTYIKIPGPWRYVSTDDRSVSKFREYRNSWVSHNTTSYFRYLFG